MDQKGAPLRPLKIVISAIVGSALMIGPMVAPVAVAAPVPPTPSGAAIDLGVSVGADGWITYTKNRSSSLHLTKKVTRKVKSKRTPAGLCDVVVEESASTSSVYTEQIGFNPATCESQLVTGELTQAEAAQLMAESPASEGPVQSGAALPGVTQTTPKTAATDVTAAATSYASAYTMGRWIDPVNIVITSQAQNLKWPLYGAGGTLTASSPWYRFAGVWSQTGPTSTGFRSLVNDGGWYVGASTHFTNWEFAALVYARLGLAGYLACGALPTTRADFYHTVRVNGYRSGAKTHSNSMTKSGACANLTHVEVLTGWGWWN